MSICEDALFMGIFALFIHLYLFDVNYPLEKGSADIQKSLFISYFLTKYLP